MCIRLKVLIIIAIFTRGYCYGTTLQDAQDNVAVIIHSNSLSILGEDTMVVFSDLYLVEASVGGTGILALKGNASQRIYSQQSGLQELLIANTDTVQLIGDLCIKKRLTIKRGIFDIRLGCLELTDTSIVELEGLAELLTSEVISEQENESFYVFIVPFLNTAPKAILSATLKDRTTGIILNQKANKPYNLLLSSNWMEIPSPPPK